MNTNGGCPRCKFPEAAVMGPLFTFRRARFWDRLMRLLQPWSDRHQVRGLVKEWAGYECVCANPKGPHRYCVTARGRYSTDGESKAVAAEPPASRPSPPPDDDELPDLPVLDDDFLIPGRR